MPCLFVDIAGNYRVGWRLRGAGKTISLPFKATMMAAVVQQSKNSQQGLLEPIDEAQLTSQGQLATIEVSKLLTSQWVMIECGVLRIPELHQGESLSSLESSQTEEACLVAVILQPPQTEQPGVLIDCIVMHQVES